MDETVTIEIDPNLVNYDEALVGEARLPPLSLFGEGAPVSTAAERAACRSSWLERFSGTLYGPPPPPPDAISVVRTVLGEACCELLTITLQFAERTFQVHAALWLPERPRGPVPLVAGLDFLGPAGVLYSDSYPIDPDAVVFAGPSLGLHDGRLAEHVRGTTSYRWPIPLILSRGWGLLLSCYGSWTPDSPAAWKRSGVWPLVSPAQPEPRAISLWAWALQRLVDVAESLPEIDVGRIAVAGHSRLGKAALWAAANDERIWAVLANNSGCAGAAPSARKFGETLSLLRMRFPHWILPDIEGQPGSPAIDQHQLLACIAPRKVYVSSAVEDLWADPRGEYLSLRAASPFWDIEGTPGLLPPVEEIWRPGTRLRAGALAWHLRPGGHDLTPWDWQGFLEFLSG